MDSSRQSPSKRKAFFRLPLRFELALGAGLPTPPIELNEGLHYSPGDLRSRRLRGQGTLAWSGSQFYLIWIFYFAVLRETSN
jgi:hypothetical protein